jgi:cytochrome P450
LQSYDPIFGNGIAQFTKPPADEMRKWVQNIPNDGLLCFREFLNRRTLIPTSPEMLKSVLSDNAYDWEKPEPVRKFLGKILGFGLLMVEGDIHKFQRKNILPSFQLKHLRELYPVFWSKAGQLVQVIEDEVRSEGLEKAEPVIEFGEWATRVTLDIIGLAGMGCDFNSIKNDDNQLVRDYKALLEPSMARVIYYAANLLGPQELIQKLPWSQNKLLADITGNLKSFCFELVRNKREEFRLNGKAGDDILALLIQSNNFSDEELVDQMLTFLAAG